MCNPCAHPCAEGAYDRQSGAEVHSSTADPFGVPRQLGRFLPSRRTPASVRQRYSPSRSAPKVDARPVRSLRRRHVAVSDRQLAVSANGVAAFELPFGTAFFQNALNKGRSVNRRRSAIRPELVAAIGTARNSPQLAPKAKLPAFDGAIGRIFASSRANVTVAAIAA